MAFATRFLAFVELERIGSVDPEENDPGVGMFPKSAEQNLLLNFCPPTGASHTYYALTYRS